MKSNWKQYLEFSTKICEWNVKLKKKFAMLLMMKGKRKRTDELYLLIQENIKTLNEKELYICLGIIDVGTITQTEMRN